MVDKALKKRLKTKYKDAQVYVVPFSEFCHIQNGFTRKEHTDKIWQSIDGKGRYIFRYDAEYEPVFQQPIPYVLIKHPTENKFFVYNRLKGEERLIATYSLGFGGHVEPQDGISNILFNAFFRELKEEVEISSPIVSSEFVGYVRDMNTETSDHIGFVFVIQTEQISIREKNNLQGEWMSLQDIEKKYHKFDNWAQHIVDYLVINKYTF